MELVYIIVDFLALGMIGCATTINLAIWYGFCEAFIFEQGYFSFINRHGFLKALLVFSIGVLIWGTALIKIHQLLWG